jgi:hypothetical protein
MKDDRRAPKYQAYFVIGIAFLPIGIATGNLAFFVIGLVFLIIGLTNRKKWVRD